MIRGPRVEAGRGPGPITRDVEGVRRPVPRGPRTSDAESRIRGGSAHLLHALLPGDGLPRPLAGAGVGAGPLAVHGQSLAVPEAAVAVDLAQAGDVLLHLAAELPLDGVLVVEQP